MANEETIIEQLCGQFKELTGRARVQRERRVFCDVAVEQLEAVLKYAAQEMEFKILAAISGTDDGEQLGAVYHLARFDGTMLNLKTGVPKAEPQLPTMTGYFASAALYERELIDLFGFIVAGLPEDAKRYPLPDNWPPGQYPLRKDWKPEILEEESKG